MIIVHDEDGHVEVDSHVPKAPRRLLRELLTEDPKILMNQANKRCAIGAYIRSESVLIKVRSSSPAISTFGHANMTSRSTSRGPASGRKMRSSRASTANEKPAYTQESSYSDGSSLGAGGRMREIPRFVMESICHNQPDSPFS